MLAKKAPLAEMAANEEVQAKGKVEMSSNEAASNELETTENEMRSLDRMAAAQSNTDSTTLVGSREEA